MTLTRNSLIKSLCLTLCGTINLQNIKEGDACGLYMLFRMERWLFTTPDCENKTKAVPHTQGLSHSADKRKQVFIQVIRAAAKRKDNHPHMHADINTHSFYYYTCEDIHALLP